MPDSNNYTGAITINPPLTRSQIAKVQEGFVKITDVKLRVINTEEESSDGNSVTITSIADAIVPLTGMYTGRSVVADIQALVDYFGDREYGGYIQVQWDSGYGDVLPTRYQVAEGRVIEVEPTMVWPGERHRSEEDVRAVAEACADFGNEEGPRGIRQLYAQFEDSIEEMNGGQR